MLNWKEPKPEYALLSEIPQKWVMLADSPKFVEQELEQELEQEQEMI